MSKRKILYSDLPRPYDDDAARLVRNVGIFILVAILLAGCLLFGLH